MMGMNFYSTCAVEDYLLDDIVHAEEEKHPI